MIFPLQRPCNKATLSRRSTDRVLTLPRKHCAHLADGRQILTWETPNPKLQDRCTIKWVWLILLPALAGATLRTHRDPSLFEECPAHQGQC